MGRQQLLYKYPPDFQKAQKHRLANRMFKGVQKDPNCESCQCCDRKIGIPETDVSCCYDKNQLAYLGPGIPLLFAYLRNSILMLLLFMLIFAGFSVYSNISSSYCTTPSVTGTCQYNIFNLVSFANKINNSDYLSIQNYILLGFVVVNIILFQAFRHNFRQIEQQCDQIVNSPSDYSIILRRLPENVKTQDIEKMVEERSNILSIEDKIQTQNLKIDHIILSYALGKYTKVIRSNSQNFKKAIEQNKLAQFTPESLPKLQQTAMLAIVVFAKQQSKQFFLYKPSFWQKTIQFVCSSCTPLSNFSVKGQRVSIQRAPQPDDIVWQNCQISIGGSIARKILYNFIGIIVLALGGGAQYGLTLLQNKFSDDWTKQLFSIALSLIIAAFNYIILQFLLFSSQKQRNQTLTQLNTVLTVKITFFQFLNTGVFVVLANFFADVQNFKITQSLSSDITIVMIMNAIVPNFTLWFLSYTEITEKVYRYLAKIQFWKVSQMQANQMWEGPKAQIPYKYAYILKTVWLTAFYAPLVPVVVPISIIGLCLNYIIEKYLYRFVYSVPNMLSSMVNDSAIQLMEYFPLIMSLGQFVVYIYMVKYDPLILPLNWSVPIYVSIGISTLNLLLPMDQLNKKCFKLKNDDQSYPAYQKVQQKFQVTYQMTNPGYECKKKRKRDVFLFNSIFGGEGKQVALNLSHIFGIQGNTERGLMKDPLLNKNEKSNVETHNNNNLLAGLLANNNQLPKSDQQTIESSNQKSGTKPQIQMQAFNNLGLQNKVQQQNNPFASFVKLNSLKNNQNAGLPNINNLVQGHQQVNSQINLSQNVNSNNIRTTHQPFSATSPNNFNLTPIQLKNQTQTSGPNQPLTTNPQLQIKQLVKSNQKGKTPKNSNIYSPTNNILASIALVSTTPKNYNKHPAMFIKKSYEVPKINTNGPHTIQNQNPSSMANQNPNYNNPNQPVLQEKKLQQPDPVMKQSPIQPINKKSFTQQQNSLKPNINPNPLQEALSNPTKTTLPNTSQQNPTITNHTFTNNNNNFNNSNTYNQPASIPALNTISNKPQIKQNSSSQNQKINSNPNTHNNYNNINQYNDVNKNNNAGGGNQMILSENNKDKYNENTDWIKNIKSTGNGVLSRNYEVTKQQIMGKDKIGVSQNNVQGNKNNGSQQQHKPVLAPKIDNFTTQPEQKIIQKRQKPQNKRFLTPSQTQKFIKTFPNLQQQRIVSKNTRQIYAQQQNLKQLNFVSKKNTQSGTILYQNSEHQQNKKHFPHVEIHVPKKSQRKAKQVKNINSNDFENDKQRQKRRSFGNAKSPQPSSKIRTDSRYSDQYLPSEIYNPRFGQKGQIDISSMYGPPKMPGFNFKSNIMPAFNFKSNIQKTQNQDEIKQQQSFQQKSYNQFFY